MTGLFDFDTNTARKIKPNGKSNALTKPIKPHKQGESVLRLPKEKHNNILIMANTASSSPSNVALIFMFISL